MVAFVPTPRRSVAGVPPPRRTAQIAAPLEQYARTIDQVRASVAASAAPAPATSGGRNPLLSWRPAARDGPVERPEERVELLVKELHHVRVGCFLCRACAPCCAAPLTRSWRAVCPLIAARWRICACRSWRRLQHTLSQRWASKAVKLPPSYRSCASTRCLGWRSNRRAPMPWRPIMQRSDGCGPCTPTAACGSASSRCRPMQRAARRIGRSACKGAPPRHRAVFQPRVAPDCAA